MSPPHLSSFRGFPVACHAGKLAAVFQPSAAPAVFGLDSLPSFSELGSSRARGDLAGAASLAGANATDDSFPLGEHRAGQALFRSARADCGLRWRSADWICPRGIWRQRRSSVARSPVRHHLPIAHCRTSAASDDRFGTAIGGRKLFANSRRSIDPRGLRLSLQSILCRPVW